MSERKHLWNEFSGFRYSSFCQIDFFSKFSDNLLIPLNFGSSNSGRTNFHSAKVSGTTCLLTIIVLLFARHENLGADVCRSQLHRLLNVCLLRCPRSSTTSKNFWFKYSSNFIKVLLFRRSWNEKTNGKLKVCVPKSKKILII